MIALPREREAASLHLTDNAKACKLSLPCRESVKLQIYS